LVVVGVRLHRWRVMESARLLDRSNCRNPAVAPRGFSGSFSFFSAKKTAAPADMPPFADKESKIGSGIGSGEWPFYHSLLPTPQTSKSAFTLIELLVYIAIMGFIIVVAGRAFADATGMRLRSQNMLNSAEEAGRVSALLKEDISQMGAKSWGRSSASTTVFDTSAGVYINFNNGNLNASDTDLSSYDLLPASSASSYDDLTFRKAYFDANGICGGIMVVRWSVSADSILTRTCNATQISKPTTCNGTAPDASECPASVEMARNVAEFRFLPSKPGAGDDAFNTPFGVSSASSFKLIADGDGTASPPSDGIVSLSGFVQNSSGSSQHVANFYLAETGAGGAVSNCYGFNFKKNEEYAIDFNLKHGVYDSDPCRTANCATASPTHSNRYNEMAMFQPGRDHLSVGLRNSAGQPTGDIPDFLFYPPQEQDALAGTIRRHFEFSVPEDVDACIGITAAFYSVAAGEGRGHLDIENFKVSRKTDNVYHFDRSSSSTYPSASSKAEVKAFELTLGINKKGEINRAVTVIPVPNNGVFAGGN